MLTLSSGKITGTPGTTGWSQVHEFLPEEIQKIEARGHLFAVMATSRTEEGVEVAVAGREILGRLHEEYFGSLEMKPFNALSAAVQKVTDEFRENWGEIEIAAAAVVGNVVYSSAGGGAGVVISREGSLATILESEKEGVVSASGFPKKGDVMMLATKAFFDSVSPGVIKAALGSDSPEAAVETFAPNVHGREDSGNLAAVVIKFDEKQQVYVPETPQVLVKVPEIKPVISSFLSKILKIIPERRIYIKPEITDEVTSQSKKLTFTVAIALLVILGISIGFGIRQKKINDLKKQYQGILVAAQNEVDQAISLASVSPDQSRQLFGDSIQKLDQIKALNVHDPKVDALEKKINDSRGAILGEYNTPPEMFLDLSLLSSGFKGDELSLSGGNIYVLDKTGKKVVSVGISTKKSKVVAGPSAIDQVSDFTSYDDRVFILTENGVNEVGSTSNQIVNKSWSGDALIHAFAANLYILDKSGNAIYRYAGTGNTFGDRQGWLAAGTKVDFSDAKAWAIDGTIYVLYPNSKIQRFSQGTPQNFSLKGVIPEIGTIDAVYADPDNQNLYFLDKAGKRVVVADKKGNYKAQYIGDQIGSANGLAVSETNKKIILLTGDKLLSVDLKNQ